MTAFTAPRTAVRLEPVVLAVVCHRLRNHFHRDHRAHLSAEFAHCCIGSRCDLFGGIAARNLRGRLALIFAAAVFVSVLAAREVVDWVARLVGWENPVGRRRELDNWQCLSSQRANNRHTQG